MKSRNSASLNAPIQVGYDAARVSHMGNVAYKTGNRIYWNDAKGAFEEEKSNLLSRAIYHNGWKLPAF